VSSRTHPGGRGAGRGAPVPTLLCCLSAGTPRKTVYLAVTRPGPRRGRWPAAAARRVAGWRPAELGPPAGLGLAEATPVPNRRQTASGPCRPGGRSARACRATRHHHGGGPRPAGPTRGGNWLPSISLRWVDFPCGLRPCCSSGLEPIPLFRPFTFFSLLSRDWGIRKVALCSHRSLHRPSAVLHSVLQLLYDLLGVSSLHPL